MITPRAARRRLMLLSALRWLPPGVSIPVLVLLVTSRGHSLATVGALFALHGAVVVALELPTGGIADVLGRRRTLLASGVINVAAALAFAVAVDLWAFVAAVVLLGTGRALGSGPLEAWYVDTVHATDPSADLKPGLARGHVAEALALAFGAIAGGLLPGLFARFDSTGGVVTPLAIPFLVAAVLGLVNLGAVAALIIEPSWQHPATSVRSGVRDIPSTVRAGLRLARADRTVLRLLLVAAAGGIVITGLEVLIPAQFADLLGGSERATAAYGIVVAVAFFASAGGSGIAPRAAGVAGTSARAALAFTAGAAAAVLGLGLAGSFLVSAAAVVLIYLLLGASGPLEAELLHERVGSSQRSTMVSLRSLLGQFGGIVGNLSLPALATVAGLPVAWSVAAFLLVLAALLFVGIPDRPHSIDRTRLVDRSMPSANDTPVEFVAGVTQKS